MQLARSQLFSRHQIANTHTATIAALIWSRSNSLGYAELLVGLGFILDGLGTNTEAQRCNSFLLLTKDSQCAFVIF
jgi:hypothetical protein